MEQFLTPIFANKEILKIIAEWKRLITTLLKRNAI